MGGKSRRKGLTRAGCEFEVEIVDWYLHRGYDELNA
jgi:hypothetical protein